MSAEPERQWKRRMSWLGFALSVPALAAWIWILVELMKDEILVGISIPVTLLIGGAAYALHRFVWKWRGTVVVTALVLHAVLLVGLMAVARGALDASVFEALGDMFGFAVDVVRWEAKNFDASEPSTGMGSLFLIGSLVFTLLHPIYPTFWTAMTSSIGFSLFIGIICLMMSRAA
ncbi:hypothetical protein HAHE_19580 [Haloferula helveola]|uniref:Uncharacterized protein n=1 Tax=Haloferula helveola TaxID=490095 RepID=A0ABM7RK92_9BACT|nr:hypothetical protein HAHE_19580 [Haloferula helveola]